MGDCIPQSCNAFLKARINQRFFLLVSYPRQLLILPGFDRSLLGLVVGGCWKLCAGPGWFG